MTNGNFKKTLIIYAHPYAEKSRANRIIMDCIRTTPGVVISDLYEQYPYFIIDVRREQRLLLESDIILFQHPLYWYSVPPLLKMWFDEVLEAGFAYGKGGTRLAGKVFQWSITAGGDQESYSSNGHHQYGIEDFFPPFKQTARLCRMKWQEPLILQGASQKTLEEIQAHGESIRLRLVELSYLAFTPGVDIS